MPVTRLLDEIRALGYTGSLNLHYTYLDQGRAEGGRIMPSPRRLTSWIMTRPPSPACPAPQQRPDEGIDTKLIKRQMYGRAGFHLLRHRVLLG